MQNALNLIESRFLIIFLIVLTLALSCSNVQERDEPEKLLSKDQMVEIYTDMILLDAAQRSNPDDFKAYEVKPSEHIYSKFGIDSITLSQSITYYNLDFEINTEIFEKVNNNIAERGEIIDSITTLKDSLKQIKKNNKNTKVKDSLKSKNNNQKGNQNRP